jgi:hypothetical protein
MIRKRVAFPIWNWQQSSLYELNGLSSSIKPIAPATSFVKRLPNLGSFNRSIRLAEFASSMSLEAALLGYPSTQVQCGSPWLSAF